MRNQLQRDDEEALPGCPPAMGTVAVVLTVPERRLLWWVQVEYAVTDLGYWRHADSCRWEDPSTQPRGLRLEVQSRYEEWAHSMGVTWKVGRRRPR